MQTMFLMTLSSTRPMPVSATASSAQRRAFWRDTSRMAAMIFSRATRPRSWKPGCAALAALTAWSTVSNTGPPAEAAGAAGAVPRLRTTSATIFFRSSSLRGII